MNNTSKNLLKVTLIVLAVAAAVSAVLIFIKSRVEPPHRLVYVNQYTQDIHKESEQIAQAGEQALEQNFQLVTDRIELMRRENLISNEEYTGCVQEYVNAYIPAFHSWCEQRFSQSVWPKTTLNFMRNRINGVNRYNTNAGGSIISGENKTRLNEVDRILNDYNEAWKLQNVTIHSSSESRESLNKAQQYKNDNHLSKCSALMDMLNNLPSRYQRSHYNYVNGLVRGLSMSHFPSANMVSEWADKYKNAKAAIKDYNSVASSLYNTTTSDFNIDSYYSQAKSGFRNKISVWDPASVRTPYEQTFGVRIN